MPFSKSGDAQQHGGASAEDSSDHGHSSSNSRRSSVESTVGQWGSDGEAHVSRSGSKSGQPLNWLLSRIKTAGSNTIEQVLGERAGSSGSLHVPHSPHLPWTASRPADLASGGHWAHHPGPPSQSSHHSSHQSQRGRARASSIHNSEPALQPSRSREAVDPREPVEQSVPSMFLTPAGVDRGRSDSRGPSPNRSRSHSQTRSHSHSRAGPFDKLRLSSSRHRKEESPHPRHRSAPMFEHTIEGRLMERHAGEPRPALDGRHAADNRYSTDNRHTTDARATETRSSDGRTSESRHGSIADSHTSNDSIETLELPPRTRTSHRRSASYSHQPSQSLRHAEIPVSTPPPASRYLVRVYREDRTFGTVACAPNVTASSLLKLAARKFFLDDSQCHLVMLYPDAVHRFLPESHPLEILEDLVRRAGFVSDGSELSDAIRSDLSFLARIYIVSKDRYLRPMTAEQQEELLRDKHAVILQNVDLEALPDSISQGLVEYIDVSKSSIAGCDPRRLPYVQCLRLSGMFSEEALMASHFAGFSSLVHLDISRNGLSNPEVLDFGHLHLLETLDIRGNQFRSLPRSLRTCTHLRQLLAGSNSLEQFDLYLESLQDLDLSFNKLAELDPKINALVNLKSFILHGNYLESLPFDEGSLPNLRLLDIRHNFITDLPIDKFPGIRRLRGSYNRPLLRDEKSAVSTPRGLSPAASAVSLPITSTETQLEAALLKGSGGPGRWHSMSPVGPQYPYSDKGSQIFLRCVRSLHWKPTVVLSTMTRLDLSRTSLLSLDESVVSYTPNLEVLNLGYNNLTRLVPDLGKLRKLQILTAWGNSITTVPVEICQLPDLQVLDLHANNIKSLPPQIWSLRKLRVLNLSSNLLELFPAVTDSVPSLERLFAGDNRLEDDCLHDIMRMPNLTILNLSNNELTELHPNLFASLAHLEVLHVGGNRLSTLPHEDFENAKHLRMLCANSNKLHTLPAELSKVQTLEVLDVSANQLRYNVSNWPFDWNWRWNTNLRYLNFSSNGRLEIRRMRAPPTAGGPRNGGLEDLSDFSVLPHLATLGLIDVTLTSSGVPDQTENCRVRTYGGNLKTCRVGISDTLGGGPLALNDLVVERFRGEENEALIGLFDGHGSGEIGNKISHLTQQSFAPMLRRALQRSGSDTNALAALRKAFLAIHREIGNTAVLTPEEAGHSFLGHRSVAAGNLQEIDRRSGTGAAVVYSQGSLLNIASVGGARIIVARSNGEHKVLARPQMFTPAELDRMRAGGGVIDGDTGLVNGIVPYSRMIGCYDGRALFSAEPSLVQYEIESNDLVIIASAELWDYLSVETVADVARSEAQDPAVAALKLRDLALSYGMNCRAMVIVLAPPAPVVRQETTNSSHYRRQHSLPRDSRLDRLGTEVAPPMGDVTMVFTDIRNSTLLWESMPFVMRAAIRTHNTIMRRSLRLMEGYEVKTEGDAFIVSFHTPARALLWCLTVQELLLNADWPSELLEVGECAPVFDPKTDKLLFQGLRVRMGVHYGWPVAEPDPVTRRMDYFGPMVNRAARISGTALGGQIAASADFMSILARKDAVEPDTAESLRKIGYVVEDVGEMKLKGIENPEHIHVIYPKSLKGRKEWFLTAEADGSADSSGGQITTPQPPPAAKIDVRSNSETVFHDMHSATLTPLAVPSIVESSTRSSTSGLDQATPFNVQHACYRLELLCTELSGGNTDLVRTMLANEPSLPGACELWMTRIENCIARLAEQLQ